MANNTSRFFLSSVICLFFGVLHLHAQWSNVRLPFGIYGFTNIEFHKTKTITSFHTLSQIRFASTSDNISWALGGILGSNSQSGQTRIFSESNNLYIFAWHPSTGVPTVQRSLDDGNNWAALSLPNTPLYSFLPVGGALYCASKSTLYRSFTGGGSWQAQLQGIGEICGLEQYDQGKIMLATHKKLLVSLDNGYNWDTVPAPYDTSGTAPSFLQIFPTPFAVYIAIKKDMEMRVYRTTNSGSDWTEIILPQPYKNATIIRQIKTVGARVWALFDHQLAMSNDGGTTWENRLSPKATVCLNVKGTTLFCGGAQGFFKSTDNANSWLSGNSGWGAAGNNLGTYKPAGLFSGHNGRIYYSTSDGLFSSGNDGLEWKLHHVSPDGAFNRFMPSGDTLFFAGKGLLRSFDGGDTWEWLTGADIAGNSLFPSRIVTRAGDYLFASKQGDPGLYRSADFGDSWQLLPAPSSGNIIGLGTDLYQLSGSGVLRSTDFGLTFEVLNQGTAEIFFTMRANQNQLFGLGYQYIYRLDAGIWKNANQGIFDGGNDQIIVRDIAGNSEVTLIAYYNLQGNLKPVVAQWNKAEQSWTGDLVANITADNDMLLWLGGNNVYITARDAATSYTRIWKRTLTVNTQSPKAENMDWRLFPTPSTGEAWINFNNELQQPLHAAIFDVVGRQLWSARILPGTALYALPVEQYPNGIYTVVLIGQNGHPTQQRLVISGR